MFLGGSRPDMEDSCVYAAASSLPSAVLRASPVVKGWLNTVGMFAPSMRAAWGGGGGAPVAAPVANKKGGKAAGAALVATGKPREMKVDDGDDDVDSLFGDDEDEEEGGGAKSRAEQMAATKAEKDKKKKLDRWGEGVVFVGLNCIRVLIIYFRWRDRREYCIREGEGHKKSLYGRKTSGALRRRCVYGNMRTRLHMSRYL